MNTVAPNQEKIVFIAGTGRNGSTIIGNVLGQVDNCISVGEIRYIWSDLLKGRLCGCGVPIRECGFWNEVLQQAFGNLSESELRFLCSMTEEIAQNYQVPKLFLPRRAKEKLSSSNLQRTEDAFRALYSAVRRVSGCGIIIDSSKKPEIQEFLLNHLCVDLYTIHLVRDPRAIVYAWNNIKINPDPLQPTLPVFNKYKTALSWLLTNLVISNGRKKKYFFVRYEDWVDAPEETIGEVVKFIEISMPVIPILQGNQVNLRLHHTISGNPSRFQTGLVDIVPDLRWKRAMSKYQQAVVIGLTWPLFLKYYLS